MENVKVLIVDDSSTMRAVIKAVLSTDPAIHIVGEAADPYEARDAIKTLNPDVITLDIEMPRMSGLQFLKKIMQLRPMPVIMVSTLTQKGAADSIEALKLGAFCCLGKPVKGDFLKAMADLPNLVKAAGRYNPKKASIAPVKPSPIENFKPNNNVVAIGSSTGGVDALFAVLSGYPINCPPTIITQHMPPAFLESFADRLNRTMKPAVLLASSGTILQQGHVYLAPGGAYHLEINGQARPECRLLEAPPVSGHRPSVDVMFSAIAKHLGPRAIGVILTGMGRDGAKGLLSIRQAGGRTLGQDKNTSIVYGMPKAAQEIGAVETELPIGQISQEIMKLCAAYK